MSFSIAVAGKGGSGKTSIASLIIRYLKKNKGPEPILAIDADPNANLGESLGLDIKTEYKEGKSPEANVLSVQELKEKRKKAKKENL